jgi:hypothetical protein
MVARWAGLQALLGLNILCRDPEAARSNYNYIKRDVSLFDVW